MLNNYNYIAYKLQNPIAAINNMKNIIKTIDSLKNFPYRGAYYSSKFNRIISYKKYLIRYKIIEEENLIIVKRIIHGNVSINRY